MNGSANPDANISPTAEGTTSPNKVSLKEKISLRFSKFKTYIKTHKKQTITVSSIFLVLMISGIVFLTTRPKPEVIKVAENIAEQQVGTGYDYIYNPNDTTLTASTLSGDKTLELINSDGIILDYAVSPNKEKIAYVIAPKNYKDKITSQNAKVSDFKFSPVGFEIYELNLKTGDNKKLWSRDSIKLGATQQQLYYKKEILFPDSYVIGYHYNTVISYPENGDPFYQTIPVSYAIPVSYSQVVDDVQRGYMYTDLPWDLDHELRYYTVSIVGYDEDSSKLAVAKDNQVTVFAENDSSNNYGIQLDSCYAPISANKKFIGDLIIIDNLNCKDYLNSGSKVFQIEDNHLNDIFHKYNVDKSRVMPKFIDSDFSLALSYPIYYENRPKNEMIFIDLSNITGKSLKSFEELNSFTEVTSSLPTVAFTVATSTEYNATNTYTFSQFSKEDNTFKDLGEIELPSDIGDLYYDYNTNNISFYRNYRANNETIIEYRIINLETKEDKELKTIKVSNNSVLYYKPKLVWLNL